MRALPVEPLAHLPDFVLGLALIRGCPTPVLDAKRLLGANVERSSAPRYVTIRFGPRNAALAVDAVIGVRHVAVSQLAELPALLHEPRNGLVQALGTLDRELLVVLERSRVLPETLWRALDVEVAAC
jgi:purine-binding chemotaxis protein CheW